MKYDFNSIPNELKTIPQWIVWRSENARESHKVPYQVNGEMAQSNNRRSWSTFIQPYMLSTMVIITESDLCFLKMTHTSELILIIV
jgi:hypothetical protein